MSICKNQLYYLLDWSFVVYSTHTQIMQRRSWVFLWRYLFFLIEMCNLRGGLAGDWSQFASSSHASKSANSVSRMGCLSTSRKALACQLVKPTGSHGSHTQPTQQRCLSNEPEWEQNGSFLLNDDSCSHSFFQPSAKIKPTNGQEQRWVKQRMQQEKLHSPMTAIWYTGLYFCPGCIPGTKSPRPMVHREMKLK